MVSSISDMALSMGLTPLSSGSGQQLSGSRKSGKLPTFSPLPAEDLQLIGQQESYLLKSTITRADAAAILKQTGLDIHLEPGVSFKTGYNIGSGDFGFFRVG